MLASSELTLPAVKAGIVTARCSALVDQLGQVDLNLNLNLDIKSVTPTECFSITVKSKTRRIGLLFH